MHPSYDKSPLNDRQYRPVNLPVNGKAPEGIEKWGPKSQVRWFHRFYGQVLGTHAYWNDYYIDSTQHRGLCCESCMEDEQNGYRDWDEEVCCCRAMKDES